MDDLTGLSWSNTPNKTQAASTGTGNYYPSLRPTPPPGYSGRSTPLSSQASGTIKPPISISKSTAPMNDSFSNLVSFGSSKASSNLSLQEQQKRLQEEKYKKAAEQRKQYDAQFGHTHFWDGMGKTTQTGGIPTGSSINSPPILSASKNPFSKPFSPPPTVSSNDDETDLLAAFSADAPVDNSSHYPPPAAVASGRNTPQVPQPPRIDLTSPLAWQATPAASSAMGDFGDDDDPFGLAELAKKENHVEAMQSDTMDDADFLGDLGKPVEEVKRKAPPLPEPDSPSSSDDETVSDDPWDKAVKDIAEMGFSEQQARTALTESGSGLDVQAAVGWLLNEAHRTAKNKSRAAQRPQNEGSRRHSPNDEDLSTSTRVQNGSRDNPLPRRENSRSPINGDDLSKTAAAVGSNLFKTANSLWKTSQKKMQKAVAEFNADSDPSRPKWMQEAEMEDARGSQRHASNGARRQTSPRRAVPDVTDEALMLESGGPPERRSKPKVDSRISAPRSNGSKDHVPSPPASAGRSTPQPRWQQSISSSALDPKSRLSKQLIEEQSSQAYISPARRKKIAPLPEPKDEPDLLFRSSEAAPPSRTKTSPPITSKRPSPVSSKLSTSIPVRPKAPIRNIPPVSPSSLASSNQHRHSGTTYFKRGDYDAAHSSYSSSLSSLPTNHPITIILLCNRSLTALKTGDPKGAVADADNALALIGPSRGENETISLPTAASGEDVKDMKEYFGKALMRKAEALEQMERWADAGAVWKEAVEAGVGAATAIQGRARCEKALAPKPKPSAPKAAPARPRPSAINDLKPASTQSTAAVNRLREANKAAEKADDEKFALSDAIEARIEKWKGGKADNLRALLGSLDQVLWPEAGWKKVGLHELVVNNKVKIIYMKAIAKVHPDKISPTASTEVRMLSENVFAILNSAWDSFRKENGM